MLRKISENDIHTTIRTLEVAEMLGVEKEIVKELLADAKDDIEKITLMAVALNWSVWRLYKTNEELARYYEKLWKVTEDYVFQQVDGKYKNFTKEEVKFYVMETD